MEDINKSLDELKSSLGDKIDQKLEHFAKEQGQFGEEYKKALKEETEKLQEKYLDLQKRFDDQEMAAKRGGSFTKDVMDFKTAVHNAFQDKNTVEGIKSFADGQRSKFSMNLKSVLTTATAASGETIAADRLSGVVYDPTRIVRVRDIMSTGTTSSNRIRYVKEVSYTNSAAMRAEASAYEQSNFHLNSADADVESLGTIVIVTKEMLEDMAVLRSYITARVPEKVLNVEDTQLLTGNGSSPNIQGLMASGGATAFVTASTGEFYNFWASGDTTPTEYDVLVAAANQCMVAEYTPNAIFLHPTDYHKIFLNKATDGQYVAYRDNAPPTIMGIPVFKSTAQTKGKFIVGDFRLGAQVFFRDAMTLEFSDQDDTNFRRDLITIKASERLTNAIYRPNAFAWGTFSTAIASLQA